MRLRFLLMLAIMFLGCSRAEPPPASGVPDIPPGAAAKSQTRDHQPAGKPACRRRPNSQPPKRWPTFQWEKDVGKCHPLGIREGGTAWPVVPPLRYSAFHFQAVFADFESLLTGFRERRVL